jgi:hypothetical protein
MMSVITSAAAGESFVVQIWFEGGDEPPFVPSCNAEYTRS